MEHGRVYHDRSIPVFIDKPVDEFVNLRIDDAFMA